MKCNLNCSECELAQKKRILVDVIGHEPDGGSLAFQGRPALTVEFGDYVICFVNYCGENVHIGRKILSNKPSVVLDIIDSMALENNLRLTSRLIDMDSRAVLAFTDYDRLLATGHSLDYETLGEMMGFPATILDPSEESFSRLLSLIVETYRQPAKKHVHVPYGQDVDKAIDRITALISDSPGLSDAYHDRYLAVRLLEDPLYITPALEGDPMASRIVATARAESETLTRQLGESPESLIRKARHGYVHGALVETLRHSADNSDHTLLQKIDAVLTNRLIGLPLLLVVLLLVFEATFVLGAWPQKWIEDGVSLLCSWLSDVLPAGWLSNLLVDGVVQGCGAVISFLPNIFILFIFLSLLEDTGYMARAAFLMDKIMHRIGLHGKSFVPMLLGFGCNVPAIMAAKSIDNRKDRTLTMLMIPFMSCSARIPVYMLFVAAFFARYKALVMIGIYLAGVLLSILFAIVMKRTKWFRKEADDYVSELPAFRKPTLRSTWSHVWERTSDYLHKITTVILAASVIIWALEYFPRERTQDGKFKEESYLCDIGKGMEPVMKPLGFDWKMNVCLLTGLPAKEAIVSTMGILYHTEDNESLAQAMTEGEGMNQAVALAFMLFVLLYFPCVATISTLRKEVGWQWAAFSVVHSLALAWIVAWLTFHVAGMLIA
ncbi:MAG: ferrous iron transport protein B [Bacteroidales bacterium]|nr:ferrous iron transport protein B [Bacteroidales bacterium]